MQSIRPQRMTKLQHSVRALELRSYQTLILLNWLKGPAHPLTRVRQPRAFCATTEAPDFDSLQNAIYGPIR